MTVFSFTYKLIYRGDNVKKSELYDLTVKSVMKYKGSGEELTDFDDFMREITKEYENTKDGQ